MHLEEIRGFLLSERESGKLVQIPPDIYQTTAILIRSLQQEVIIMDDPFSDEARLLIEKVASIRTTAEELFHLRSEKIVDLAQSQADGSYIDREELRTLIPAEIEMFNRIVDVIRECRVSLIEWRSGARIQTPVRVKIPERLSDSEGTSHEKSEYDREEAEESVAGSIRDVSEMSQDAQTDNTERAYDQEEGWTPSDEEEEESFPYNIVRVQADMESFMGVDERTYELKTGDIITLPRRNAEVLAGRDKVLNINPG